MAIASAKYIRMSPRKVRRVIDVIRGKHVSYAKTVLRFLPYSAVKVVEKVLNSAISNAKENENLAPDRLKISKAIVNEAPMYKRWRAVSRGRGFPILKRNSHVTIEVVPTDEKPYSKASHMKAGRLKGTAHHHGTKEHGHTHETKADDKTTVKESKSKKPQDKKKTVKAEEKKEKGKKKETKGRAKDGEKD